MIDIWEEIIKNTGRNDPDSDDDGLWDGWEVQYGLNATNSDSDGDTLPDGQEDADNDLFRMTRHGSRS